MKLSPKAVRTLTLWTVIGMGLVLLMGSVVTKTESGMGCGSDFPLCHGKLIPAKTIESMIEYSHRFVSGLVGLLVLYTTAVVWKSVRERADARWFAAIALLFTIVQAIMGALVVKMSQASGVLALHFGFSLIAFAASLLLAIVARQRTAEPQSGATRAVPVSPGFKWLVAVSIVYCYVVVYLGAFVRHTESAGGCTGWPLCNGEVIPELSGPAGIAFLHRIAGLLLMIVVAVLGHIAYRHQSDPTLRRAGVWATVLVVAQVLSGGLVVFTLGSEQFYLFTSLLHTMLISGLFGVLTYMGVLTLRRAP
ncbi:heme A synthase [Paenibacillus thermoaerophilus]|uniref:Heme A synthase n=1 Tax=Paenibacillus thermoaerophilus TaxID=1215385 RepID=A0ABW2V142_9BACL|nr:COX15/CtaA family protein [Paenibacillus thermoaerophilus]TMV18410.1 heme A synthase [Paenibacillus thermoaerophilus]